MDRARDDHGRSGGGSGSSLRLSSRALPRKDGDRPGWVGMTEFNYATFMGGGCGEFAIALQELYGTRVALSVGSDGGLDHAFAYDDQGNAWDAGGRDKVGNLMASVESYETHDHIEWDASRQRTGETSHGFNEGVLETARRTVLGSKAIKEDKGDVDHLKPAGREAQAAWIGYNGHQVAEAGRETGISEL
jgi:hypothetical protein